MKPENSEWREFENAVAAFVKALDPNATVKQDIRLPDQHHQGLRQRDVWIEGKICRHFPVSVLVSCKHWKRKLHSGDIDAFNGELAASSASFGVLYSRSGFSKKAIEKARHLGIPCCRLFRREPPEIPVILALTAYCCMAQISLSMSPFPAVGFSLRTWGDLFQLELTNPCGERNSLLDKLASEFRDSEAKAVASVTETRSAPPPFEAEVIVPPRVAGGPGVRVVALGHWKFYRAKFEAYEVNGSYEFTSGDFKGQIATPSVDRLGSEPGPGWERTEKPPSPGTPLVMMILYKGDVKTALQNQLAQKTLTEPTQFSSTG